MTTGPDRYPPIADYAFIGDCHSSALLARDGSIDWCCLPRFDHGSVFGRLLDWERGGHCRLGPSDPAATATRRYVDDTMVVETTFRLPHGDARLVDCFPVRDGGANRPHRQLLRIVESQRGELEVEATVAPRFDYGTVLPWLRQHRPGLWSAVGGNDALVISSDVPLHQNGLHDLTGSAAIRSGARARLSICWCPPEHLEECLDAQPGGDELDRRLETTLMWWRTWAARASTPDPAVRRSALVLKALTDAPTGSVAAAPTTSLPESIGNTRNWDYRYTWIRDSQFSVRSLAELGFEAESDGFRRFIERTAAGSPHDLQIAYGLDGRRRLPEAVIPLEGYRGSGPVRTGNAACEQLQLDAYGELLDLAWRWHERGRSPDDDYWRFLVALVDIAAERWSEPDHGIWEVRGDPQHFVHSKVMCWAAVDRGIALAEACARRAPLRRWKRTRSAIRASIESDGFDQARNRFRRAYGTDDLDAALLLIPSVGFLAYDDPAMVSTTDGVVDELDDEGLLRRYRSEDGLDGEEGVFVACTFWLVECLARQGRLDEARGAYQRAASAANDLGLYAEQFDPSSGALLGNFPQGLSHLSHIAAAVALADAAGPRG